MIGALADMLSNWRRGQEYRRWFVDIKRNQETDMKDHERKDHPVTTGVFDYFPDAIAAVAAVSMEGARKHNTFNERGEPTWDRSKSADDADALGRHLLQRGKFDVDGRRHSAKVAWRSLAMLQKELDAAAEYAAVYGDDYERKGDGAMAQAASGKYGAAVNGVSKDEILKAKAPKPEPGSLLKQHEGLTEVEQFATWLTTRDECVHVGAEHTVYDMFDALNEWNKLRRIAK